MNDHWYIKEFTDGAFCGHKGCNFKAEDEREANAHDAWHDMRGETAPAAKDRAMIDQLTVSLHEVREAAATEAYAVCTGAVEALRTKLVIAQAEAGKADKWDKFEIFKRHLEGLDGALAEMKEAINRWPEE